MGNCKDCRWWDKYDKICGYVGEWLEKRDSPKDGWEGDLKLIEIHAVHK